MFDIQHHGSFVAAILVFQAVPGAGTVAILDATARHGRATGLAAVAGTLAGDALHMLAAVAGLAAVLQARPGLLLAAQLAGAAYLGWSGWQLLRARGGGAAPASPPGPVARRAALRRALAVSLSNPKVMLFFVAFFPLFLPPGAPTGTLAAMVLHVTVLSALYQAGLVFVGAAVARRLRAWPGASRAASRLAGLALLGLGLRLALSAR